MLAWTRLLRPTPQAVCVRSLAHKAAPNASKAVLERTTAAGTLPGAASWSSCSPNTVLVGMNYLKDQPPVLALPDEEYPSWLWKLLDNSSQVPDDGPGGKAEKRQLRKENRQRIRDQNFMKTQ